MTATGTKQKANSRGAGLSLPVYPSATAAVQALAKREEKANGLKETQAAPPTASEVITMLNTSRDSSPPRALKMAVTSFFELLEEDGNVFVDALSNETSENYKAIVAALHFCRNATMVLEEQAKYDLQRERDWHIKRLAAIESVCSG